MEPDVVVDFFQRAIEKNGRKYIYVGDDDATKQSQIRDTVL